MAKTDAKQKVPVRVSDSWHAYNDQMQLQSEVQVEFAWSEVDHPQQCRLTH